jgi:hypothetical protein
MAGGLATTSTIVRADFWRLGQCRPGDSLRFKRISFLMSAHCHLRITHQWQDDRVISVPVQPSIWVWFIDHVGWVTAPFSSVFSGPFQTRTFETVSVHHAGTSRRARVHDRGRYVTYGRQY